ncbi:hypothetical protein HN858_00060 [Candidatus Falkowbacteria bacterium]|jgi:hypothetical protein|nr:hypothetical protein [Candidatus Falkowbacteria bacterium]MBT5502718.1 hypothetical protein [Candidatus Falkowbacteria bacterium]MBT6573498.1 hypothetical protein [Candidatus Falkowbacteria bacterium]MBT7348048.1 hypothetical protein [Candidatus Falkowbacteria bacterium]MBT7501117.1 hypothetical protein [Candidatus Falkowbacteria bacterium]
MKKCITCEKQIEDEKIIAKHDVNFCCEDCLKQYEEKLKELDGVVDWDDCC